VVVIGPSTATAAYLKSRLGARGTDVTAHRRVEGLQREPFADAIVLDGGDVIDGTAAVRRATAAPLLVIGRDQLVGATCLAMGADAWLAATSTPALVAAQVEALMRRRPLVPAESTRKAGRLKLDAGARRVEVDGREVQLSPREFSLLEVFVSHQGVVLSRDRILAAAWDSGFVGEPKTVDVHVAWLRPKLEGSGLRVTTLRGIGYRLDVLEVGEPEVKSLGGLTELDLDGATVTRS